MNNKAVLTKTLAITGAALAWFPLLAPIFLTVVFFITHQLLRFDFLMPAELFPFALAGGGLLLWAALRAGSRQRLIGWGLGSAAGMLAGGQTLAIVTGLASGETEPAGVWWVLALASIALYTLALVAVSIGSVLLLRDLFKSTQPPEHR